MLTENHIDLIILAGFMTILTQEFTRCYPKRILNVHPSLIPSFCGEGFYGLRVHQAALDYGVKVTGATVHFVNEITDGGEIIAQKAGYIEPGDTFYGLRVHQAALDYGVKVTGATVHFVNEITDGGEIIAQKAGYIEPGDTPESLQRLVMEQAEWVLLPQAAEQLCAELNR